MHYDSAAKTATEKSVTLNERVNSAIQSFGYQCERIESVLGRVNGTPQRIEGAQARIEGAQAGKAPAPILSLQNNVESLEALVERLVSLTNGVERIA